MIKTVLLTIGLVLTVATALFVWGMIGVLIVKTLQ